MSKRDGFIEDGGYWAVVGRFSYGQTWHVYASTLATTRASAIAHYRGIWGDPKRYEKLRRRGLVRTARVRLVVEVAA